jgi:macrolide-specific efflux system membrane fusion protein
MSKKPLIVVLAIAAVAAGGWYYFANEKNGTGKQTNFAKVEKGNIEETVTAQGKLEPKEYVDVGTQVSGQLSKLYFKIGDTVKKGDLLAQIDPKVYESRMEGSEASLKRLKAQASQHSCHWQSSSMSVT